MKHRLRTLAHQVYFGEGPRWRNGRLWFSDFYAHRVCSVDLAGDVRTELELEGRPSGLGWMPDGSLLISDDYADAIYRVVYEGQF